MHLVRTVATLIPTLDQRRIEVLTGRVGVRSGLLTILGSDQPRPATRRLDAIGFLLTLSQFNTHCHLFPNLMRAYHPKTDKPPFS